MAPPSMVTEKPPGPNLPPEALVRDPSLVAPNEQIPGVRRAARKGLEDIAGAVKKAQTDAEGDDFATFVSLRGSEHKITIEPMKSELVAGVGGRAREQFDPRTGNTIVFADGEFQTDDVNLIKALLLEATGLGRDYDINWEDPTGFWTRHNVIELKPETVMRVAKRADRADALRIVAGAIGAADSLPTAVGEVGK